MQRYFIHPKQYQNSYITLTGDDVYHIKKVMRYKTGSRFVCVDGIGNDYLVEVVDLSSTHVKCKVIHTDQSQGEPAVKITLAQSIPKGERWDWILQKGTELGVSQFVPFFSSRTIVKIPPANLHKKMDRWQRIVKEAAEQSHRGKQPIVAHPLTWVELLAEIEQQSHAWMAYEKGGKPLRRTLQEPNLKHIFLIIGPEGGFSDEEIVQAQSAGATPITLGNRILRTETASIATLSAIMYAQHELGGE